MGYPALSRASEGFLLDKQASGRSSYTVRNYREHLTRLAAFLGDPPLDQVQPDDLKRFMAWLRDEYRTARDRKLSPKSIKNYWGGLSAFWQWAERQYHLANPFTLEAPRASLPVVHPLSPEDVDSLLKATEYTEVRTPTMRMSSRARRHTALRDKAIILCMVDTGVRVQELCDARVQDVDDKTGRWLVTGKGERQRFVYLGQVARRQLWLYLADRFPQDDPAPDAWLFAQEDDSSQLTRNGVRLLLGRLGVKGGVPDVHPHRLRHTFAIEYLRNGGDVFTLQRLLGHSSLEMVRRYLAIAQVDLQAAHRKNSPVDRWRSR